jgi:hypothetical protein
MVEMSEQQIVEIVVCLAAASSVVGNGDATVERHETHGAVVFLIGACAWKIKRAVAYPYMDFSTLQKRHAALLRELEINRHTAPDLYLGVHALTRADDGRLVLDGDGEVIEYVLRMRRFPQLDLLGAIARQQGISVPLAESLAMAVQVMHRRAPARVHADGDARIARVLDHLSANLAGCAPILPAELCAGFTAKARGVLERLRHVLADRGRGGHIRRCHGDLHLDNIVLWNGVPTPFDALEFDEALAEIDTFYDLAFVLMDLWRLGQRSAANACLNRYLWLSRDDSDLDALATLPLFLAMRAGIRSLVTAERAETKRELELEARTYLDVALRFLDSPDAQVVAIGGLSGSGKSTVAAALAPQIGGAPGAIHLRSDLERKAMFGVPPTERLPPAAYGKGTSARVYATLMDKARRVATAGRTVIVDAVFGTPDERAAVARVAQDLQVPFYGAWLNAPIEILQARVAARRNDASDATVAVVDSQFDRIAPPTDWHVWNAEEPPSQTAAAIQRDLA